MSKKNVPRASGELFSIEIEFHPVPHGPLAYPIPVMIHCGTFQQYVVFKFAKKAIQRNSTKRHSLVDA